MLPVLALGLLLAAPPPARADLVKENATLNYSPSSKRWDFSAVSAAGSIGIAGTGIAKQLAKLKQSGAYHNCIIEYDTDSKIESVNGDFYSTFKISKCD